MGVAVRQAGDTRVVRIESVAHVLALATGILFAGAGVSLVFVGVWVMLTGEKPVYSDPVTIGGLTGLAGVTLAVFGTGILYSLLHPKS